MAGFLAFMQSDYPATRPPLDESLSIYKELGPAGQPGIANTLILLGDLESGLGNYATASALMEEALGILQDLKDVRGIGRALWQLGQCAARSGDFENAILYFEQALSLLRQLGDRSNIAITLTGLADVTLRHGDFKRASIFEQESLTLRREINDTWGIAVSLGNFAWIALRQDDLKQAATLLGESINLRREIGDKGGVAWCLEKMAEISLITGLRGSAPEQEDDFRRAARLFGAAETLRAPVNSVIDLVDQPEYERQVDIVRTQLNGATFTAAWAQGGAMTLEQVIEYGLAASHSQDLSSR